MSVISHSEILTDDGWVIEMICQIIEQISPVKIVLVFVLYAICGRIVAQILCNAASVLVEVIKQKFKSQE